MTASTDIVIIEGLKAGQESAFRYLFDHHYALLCHVAENFVNDAFVAESIVGDMIFHLWEIRAQLDIATSLRAYLVQSVRNRCLNYLRRQHGSKHVQLETLTDSDMALLSDGEPDRPLGLLIERELEEKIYAAISRLPDECRRVFEMSRFDGMTYEEIAAATGISVNTVKYHVKRALRQLHQDIAPYMSLALFIALVGMLDLSGGVDAL